MRNRTGRSLLCAAVVAVTFAAGLSASHSWGGYHWARRTSQFTLKLGDNLTTADWRGHLAQTSRDWNTGNTPVLTAVVAGQAKKRCSMVAGTSQVCNGTYGRNGWLGLASINIINGVHITQGSAKMNDTYFNTSTYNNPNEREHVMCQEVAHTFGLAHQSEDGSSQNSCMDYFSNTGVNAGSTVSTRPNAHDFEELRIIYQHLDSTTTVAAMAAVADRPDVSDTEDAKNWGQLVSQTRNGRSSTYERFESDGSQTLTHVYWTLEAAETCRGCDHRFDH
jgi:hypothetical protein